MLPSRAAQRAQPPSIKAFHQSLDSRKARAKPILTEQMLHREPDPQNRQTRRLSSTNIKTEYNFIWTFPGSHQSSSLPSSVMFYISSILRKTSSHRKTLPLHRNQEWYIHTVAESGFTNQFDRVDQLLLNPVAEMFIKFQEILIILTVQWIHGSTFLNLGCTVCIIMQEVPLLNTDTVFRTPNSGQDWAWRCRCDIIKRPNWFYTRAKFPSTLHMRLPSSQRKSNWSFYMDPGLRLDCMCWEFFLTTSGSNKPHPFIKRHCWVEVGWLSVQLVLCFFILKIVRGASVLLLESAESRSTPWSWLHRAGVRGLQLG